MIQSTYTNLPITLITTYQENTAMPCYPNYGLFQKNRAITLREANHKCKVKGCTNPGKQAHHIDGDETNHDLDNLMAVCCRCHRRFHRKQASKKYGFKFERVIGCKFCAHQANSWERLFMHALGVHPAKYTAVQYWLDGKSPSEEDTLIDEWETKISINPLDTTPTSVLKLDNNEE